MNQWCSVVTHLRFRVITLHNVVQPDDVDECVVVSLQHVVGVFAVQRHPLEAEDGLERQVVVVVGEVSLHQVAVHTELLLDVLLQGCAVEHADDEDDPRQLLLEEPRVPPRPPDYRPPVAIDGGRMNVYDPPQICWN